MTEPSLPPVAIGDLIAGKYRVVRVLGSGGMGMVVEALHVELDQRVAIKVMLPAAAESPAAVDRFGREARASAKLHSDNIVHVTDVGTLDSGAPFMVMEYLEGEDLGRVLVRGGPLSVDDAVDYILQACAGLSEAHAAGVIHRDLKPANLFLARRDDTASVVKVVDFGISKVSFAADVAALTGTRDLMGSPLYMSPEQLASSRDVDARSDIWSLGVILYELLAGRAPFDGDTLPQLCSAVLIAPPAPLAERREGLPPELLDVVARCLEKRPADRYQSVGELAAALADLAPERSAPTLARIARLGPVAPPEPTEEPVKRSPRRVWLAVVAVAIAGVALAAFTWQRDVVAPGAPARAPSASASDVDPAELVPPPPPPPIESASAVPSASAAPHATQKPAPPPRAPAFVRPPSAATSTPAHAVSSASTEAPSVWQLRAPSAAPTASAAPSAN